MASRRRQFGSVRKIDGGRWQVRFRDPLTGKRLPAPTTFATKGEASRWLGGLESGRFDLDRLAVRNSDERLGPYGQEWIAHRKLKPRTRETYEGQWRLHIVPTLGLAKISRLEARHVRSWYAGLLAGELSEVTVAKVYRLLRSILNTAVEDGFLTQNPCQIKGGGIERSDERSIPILDDVRRISAALPARYALVPWIAVLAGLRKGEIFGLARRHVSVRQGTIRVERAIQEITGAGAVFVSPKSSASVRTVTVPTMLRRMIELHLAEHVAADPEALLFTNTRGRPVRRSVWVPAWRDARISTGLSDLRLHDLRHLAGTLTAQAGATLRETMDRLGHQSTAAAMRYQHVASERAEEVARRLDDLLESDASPIQGVE